MSNVLIDFLPEYIEIDGVDYSVNFSFRDCLRIIIMFEADDLAKIEKMNIMLQMLYVDFPQNRETALRQGIKFLNCGIEPKVKDKDNESDEPERVDKYYSFITDSSLIYAAFKQTHNIDLTKENLHWWQFDALFKNLGTETAFCQMVALRKRVKTGKATRDEKQLYASMTDYHLKEVDTRTKEQKEKQDKFRALLEESEKENLESETEFDL